MTISPDSDIIQEMIRKRSSCTLKNYNHVALVIEKNRQRQQFWGENSNKRLFSNHKITTHAEVAALNKFLAIHSLKQKKIKKIDIIVIRINKTGHLCESKPCMNCMKILRNSGVYIDNIYCSTAIRTIECIKFDKVHANHVSRGWKRRDHM
jgi:hypothetical protein